MSNSNVIERDLSQNTVGTKMFLLNSDSGSSEEAASRFLPSNSTISVTKIAPKTSLSQSTVQGQDYSKLKSMHVLSPKSQAINSMILQSGQLKTVLTNPTGDAESHGRFSNTMGGLNRPNVNTLPSSSVSSPALFPIIKKQDKFPIRTDPFSSGFSNVYVQQQQAQQQIRLGAKRRKNHLAFVDAESDENMSDDAQPRYFNEGEDDEDGDDDYKPCRSRARVSGTKRRVRSSDAKQEPVLLLPLRTSHNPTNYDLPVLDLAAKLDPLASLDSEQSTNDSNKNSEDNPESTNANNTSNTGPTATTSSGPMPGVGQFPLAAIGRMKSSAGIYDIDPEDLKHYRRLNGYTLFVLVNKKKYGNDPSSNPNDDPSDVVDQKMLNRRWQALWSTLPEKTRREWKSKAKRMVKQMEQQNKRESWFEARRAKEHQRVLAQLNRNKINSYNLLDLAAHFQLLSDRFTAFAKQADGYEGPIDVEGSQSLLLDGLLTCLIPLTALATELEPLSDSLDRKIFVNGLSSLTYVAPF